MYYSMCNTII